MQRRKFLTRLSMTSGSIVAAGMNEIVASPQQKREKPIKVLQVTDSHSIDQYNCRNNFEKLLQEIDTQVPNPDLILHTGDVIMDALVQDRQAVKEQWQLWKKQIEGFSKSPYYAIGNHDIWGKGPKSDLQYGKKWAIDELGLSNRYYSFEKGPWKLIVLDSTQTIDGNWYDAYFDEEQVEWLKGELVESKDKHVMIISHIPILSASIFHWGQASDGLWSIKSKLMHGDTASIQAILRMHPQVKLCISGHLHLLDQVKYDGIDYLGCGAVCANWWRSDTFGQTKCGFAEFDLHPDGSYDRVYHAYHWK